MVKNILDIIDVRFMQNVQDFIAKTMDIALISVDKGAPITAPSNFSNIFIKYAKGSLIACKQCSDCQKKWIKTAAKKNQPIIFNCCTGLTSFVVPVKIEGRHMASILGGQVLTKKPIEKEFRKIAQKLGISEGEYIEEIKKIKIVSAKNIDEIADLLYLVANSVTAIAYANYKLLKLGLGYTIPRNIAMEEWFFADSGKTRRAITDREFEVLKLIVQGMSNTEIGKKLFISTHTVKAHVSSILEKLFVEDRVQVAVKVIREGLI